MKIGRKNQNMLSFEGRIGDRMGVGRITEKRLQVT